MDKFLQQFKDNLENRPSPPYDDTDWEDMQSRLNQTSPNSNLNFSKYWMAIASVVIIGLVISNLFFYINLQKANEKIIKLETTATAPISNLSRSTEKNDSKIVQNQEQSTSNNNKTNTGNINQPTDNISNNQKSIESLISNNNTYSNNNVKTEANKSSTSAYQNQKKNIESSSTARINNVFTKNKNINSKSAELLNSNNSNVETFNQEISSEKIQEGNEATSFTKEIENRDFIKLSPLPSILLKDSVYLDSYSPYSTISLNTFYQLNKKNKRKRQQPFLHLRPKGLEVGAFIHLGKPFVSRSRDAFGLGGGILANIKFSNALRLNLSLNMDGLNYEAQQMGEKFGVPELDSPNDDYEFDEAKVERNIWSGSIGLTYQFRHQRKVRPLLGIGFGMSSFTKNEVVYEFDEINGQQGHGNNNSIFSSQNFKKGDNLPFVLFQSGIAYQFRKNWILEVTGNYTYRINDFNNQLPNLFNLQTGILYSF